MSARTLIHGTAKQTARQSRHRFHAHFRAFRSAEHRAHRLLHRNHENAVHEVLPDLPRLTHAHVPSAVGVDQVGEEPLVRSPVLVDFLLGRRHAPRLAAASVVREESSRRAPLSSECHARP